MGSNKRAEELCAETKVLKRSNKDNQSRRDQIEKQMRVLSLKRDDACELTLVMWVIEVESFPKEISVVLVGKFQSPIELVCPVHGQFQSPPRVKAGCSRIYEGYSFRFASRFEHVRPFGLEKLEVCHENVDMFLD